MSDEIASADYLACKPEQRHYNRQVIEALNQAISGRGPCIVEGDGRSTPRAPMRGPPERRRRGFTSSVVRRYAER